MIHLFSRVKQWARTIKRDVLAIWFVARDPATPLAVRILAMAVAAYALSPIDLIPDFVPVLGYLDDLLIVPLALWLVLRLTPPPVLAAARAKALLVQARPQSRLAALSIILLWLLGAVAFVLWLRNR